jgi:hypothetical protein
MTFLGLGIALVVVVTDCIGWTLVGLLASGMAVSDSLGYPRVCGWVLPVR